MEYDPIRLLTASTRTQNSALDSLDRLAQRLAEQAPIQRPQALGLYSHDSWSSTDHALPTAASAYSQPPSRLSRVHTISSVDSEPEVAQEKERLDEFARKWVEALSDPGSSSSGLNSSLSGTDINAFCRGTVEEIYFSGSLSTWQCRHCGNLISFDYTKVDRSQAFAHLIFACHQPVKSGTTQYRCIICRALGLAQPSAMESFGGKMELVAHLGTHTVEDFEGAEFEGEIRENSIP